MPAQIAYGARGERNQPVYQRSRRAPGGYAPRQGGGKPGRASSNQIRKLKAIRGRIHGVSVLPSHSKGTARPHVQRGMPPGRTPQPATATRRTTQTVAAPARSGLGAYRQSNKKNTGARRGVVRGFTAG